MIVLDTNAAVAIAMGTDLGDALVMLRNPDECVIAPSFMHAEVAHVMSKYVRGGYLEVSQAVDCARDALLLVDEFRDDASLWTEALTESLRLAHSSYDLFYLVLARREGATLFTLDRKLQNLCDKTALMPFGSTAILGEDSLIQLSQYLRQLTRQNCPGNFCLIYNRVLVGVSETGPKFSSYQAIHLFIVSSLTACSIMHASRLAASSSTPSASMRKARSTR